MNQIQKDIQEELKLLRQLVKDNNRIGNLVLSILGVVLALAGLGSLILSIVADGKINKIHAHTSSLVKV